MFTWLFSFLTSFLNPNEPEAILRAGDDMALLDPDG